MNIAEIDDVVARINAFVARHLWMDFQGWEYNSMDLVISGTLDESYWSDLRVTFRQVCWASLRLQGWHSNAPEDVLFRVDGEEATIINLRYEIEEGHHLFKFLPEDFREPMWIAAQGIDVDFTRIDFRNRAEQ